MTRIPRRSQAELERFAEFVLGTAIEDLVNTLAVFHDGQTRFRALNLKKERRTLTATPDVNEWIKYRSLIHAHFVACRQLSDFLTEGPPAKHKDDAHAWQFFAEPDIWLSEVSRVPAPPKAVRDKVNKTLLHLTFSNPLLQTNKLEFSMDYTVYVLHMLEVFLQKVRGGPIDEGLRRKTLGVVSEFRSAFKPIVEANTREWLARGGVPPP